MGMKVEDQIVRDFVRAESTRRRRGRPLTAGELLPSLTAPQNYSVRDEKYREEDGLAPEKRTTRDIRHLIIVAALFVVACDGGPTAPTPVPDPPVVVVTPQPEPQPEPEPTVDPRVRPVDPRFDLNLWEELIYAKRDREKAGLSGPCEICRSLVLDHMRDFYIRTESAAGRMSSSLVASIRAAIPEVWRDLTGEPFTGRIETGTAARERGGWTTVVLERSDVNCGTATTVQSEASDPMEITLNPDNRCDLVETFRHEMAHTLGLSHLSDPSSILYIGGSGRSNFSASEKYHAQLAYERGRGALYCGWPFSAECFD